MPPASREPGIDLVTAAVSLAERAGRCDLVVTGEGAFDFSSRAGKVPFFKQSDEIGNIALVYEKYGIEARLAYAFNSDYLDSVGGNPDQDGYIAERKVLDAKVSYRITPRLRIFAEFLNIEEEPLREFLGYPSRPSSLEIYSWNANLGISFNL